MVDNIVMICFDNNDICFNVKSFFFFADCTHTQTQNLETSHDLTSVLNMYIFLLIKLMVSTSCHYDVKSSTFLWSSAGKNILF